VTTVGFNVGGLLQSHFGGSLGSVLQGAAGSTQGTISFVTKVLDKYTNTNAGDSIREKDGISDTVPTSGTSAAVVTVSGGVATPTGSSVTDGSSVGDSVTQGNLQLTVVAVNGSSADTTDIHPGDTVTYALTYNLTTGDYGNLNLTAFLPLPVFNAADPNANGGSVATYTADNVDPFPTVGAYKLVNPGTGMTVVGNATNATANSINFNLGTRDDPTNASSQQAIIYFSVIASTAPYADALQLTAQGASSYTNAAGSTAAAAAIRPVLLNEPELKVKTGIVSLVTDTGAVNKGTYSVDPNGSGQTTSPAPSGATDSPFQPAGTTTGSDPLTGSGLPFSSDDLNVTGADASDSARVVSTVTNAGHATAYAVKISGTLPAGYTTADVHNFGIYNASGVQIDTGVTAAQYFAAGGVTLPDAGGIAGQTSIFVVYDLKLQATQATGVTLTPSSSIVNWTNIPSGGTNFVTGGTPVGEEHDRAQRQRDDRNDRADNRQNRHFGHRYVELQRDRPGQSDIRGPGRNDHLYAHHHPTRGQHHQRRLAGHGDRPSSDGNDPGRHADDNLRRQRHADRRPGFRRRDHPDGKRPDADLQPGHVAQQRPRRYARYNHDHLSGEHHRDEHPFERSRLYQQRLVPL